MAAFTMGAYGDDDDLDEQQELEMYGLTNSTEDDDGDEDEEDVEQAMWMKIHYADGGDDDARKSSTPTKDDDDDDSNPLVKDKIGIQVSSYKSDETLAVDRKKNLQNYQSTLSKPVIVEVIDNKTEPNKRKDCFYITTKSSSSNESDSKYSLLSSSVTKSKSKSQASSSSDIESSDEEDLSNITMVVNSKHDVTISDNDVPQSEQEEITCLDVSLSSENDVYVIDTKSVATPVVEEVQTTNKKRINRSSSTKQVISLASSADDDIDVIFTKKRSWNAQNNLVKSREERNNQINQSKAVKGNSGGGRYKSVIEIEDSESETDSDSDDIGSDCMVIESMSEDDEQFDFNVAFQPSTSKQGQLQTDYQKVWLKQCISMFDNC